MRIIIYIINKKLVFKYFPATKQKTNKKKYIIEFEDKLDKLLQNKYMGLYI